MFDEGIFVDKLEELFLANEMILDAVLLARSRISCCVFGTCQQPRSPN